MNTLAEQFQQSAQLYGDKPCLSTYQPGHDDKAAEVVSYRQFYSALRQQALQLRRDHGLRQGDTIALLADNSLAYVILAFGATLAGIRVLLLSTKVLPEHLQHFLQSSECKLIFTSAAYESLARGSGCATAPIGDYHAPAASTAAEAELPTIDSNACALIMHTSGTTSVPRLVYLSHRNILSNQQAVQRSVGAHWTGADRLLLFLPLFHGYTLLSQLLRNISIGASTVLLQQSDSLKAESLVAALQHSGVSFFCCVPWMLRLLHDLILHEQKHGSSPALATLQKLNFIVTGGAPLERNTGDFFTAKGVRIVTFFGLTEAAGFVMHSSFDPLSTGHWDLLNPVADPGIGFEAVAPGASEYELVLSASPMIAVTADAGGKPTTAQRYGTSDLFRRADGGWAYLGRNDQLYNGPHGEKINPLLFESEVAKLASVHRVYVNGEDLLFNYALVELKAEFADAANARNEVLAAIQARVNPALEVPARVYPNDVIVLAAGEHLPLNAKGTVDRKAAKQLLAARIGAASAQEKVQDTGDLAAVVQQQVRAYLELPPGATLAGNEGLLELGFDSLMVLSLRNSLQRLLQLEIPLDLMLGFPTLDALVASLEAARHAAPSRSAQRASGSAAGAAEWARIPLEQVIFHTAHYTFPFPTYNVSMSLLAPQRLSLAEVEAGMRYLESQHAVLRTVYRPEGLFKVERTSFVNDALLGIDTIDGSHDIGANPAAQAIIGNYLNCAFDLSKGPVYRYALIDVKNADGLVRTLVYVGLNHICGDFKGFNALASELMEYFSRGDASHSAPIVDDAYATHVVEPSAADLLSYQNDWRQLMTVMPTLKEGLDFRAGHRQYFHFADVKLDRIAAILRKHNISLYNGVYAIYAVALSRHLANQSLENFQTATAVTSRIRAETENLMGCFIHSPMLRFHLDSSQSLLQMMQSVQQTTRSTFTDMIVNPAAYLRGIVADPSNLVPFITRNVFLYRSPDEIVEPPAGWASYRNEFFFESCDVGMYLDFCANRHSQAMEGYVLINLHYCEPDVIQPILDDIRTLLIQVGTRPDLDFSPLACVTQP